MNSVASALVEHDRPTLTVAELSKHYRGGVLANDRINLEIRRGEVFGLLGPNGAGKTTTLSMLATLMAPSAGDAQVFGRNLAREPEAVRPLVGLVLSAVDRTKTPVVLAPAMNDAMWNQPSTQRNAKQAIEDGFTLVGPGDGWQACRHVGTGRMAEPEQIVAALAAALGS